MGFSALSSWIVQLFNNEIMANAARALQSSNATLARHPKWVSCGRSVSRAGAAAAQSNAAGLGLVHHCWHRVHDLLFSSMLSLTHPWCDFSFHPVALLSPRSRRVGRERCARTVTARRYGDRLGVTPFAGTVSCSLSQLFILPAGIFLKQILPCVLRLGFIEWNHNSFLRV